MIVLREEMMRLKKLTTLEPNVFIVSKTSSCGWVIPPVEGAYLCELTNIDYRNTDDPIKLPFAKGCTDWWYKEGTNHRIVDGKITRDLGYRKVWTIEIPDVMEFVREHGKCVVGFDNNIPYIEIYDDYRE